jgi:hypothetical protein
MKNIYTYSIVDSEVKTLLKKLTLEATKKSDNFNLFLDNLILIISTSQIKEEAIHRLNHLNLKYHE